MKLGPKTLGCDLWSVEDCLDEGSMSVWGDWRSWPEADEDGEMTRMREDGIKSLMCWDKNGMDSDL
jgi:hypothetical protein